MKNKFNLMNYKCGDTDTEALKHRQTQTETQTYILKVGISGIRDSANFSHFPPKFRLRTRKLSRLHCTIASPSVCRVFFIFNINNSYVDLLYFDNLLLKIPDLCNLRTFIAIFLVAIYALFPPIF